MPVALGPYPLCPACRMTNGGLIAVRHRQIHLKAHGKEACVDRGIAGLLGSLWAVCDTRSCCEDEGGRAYVVPTAETCDAATQLLSSLRLHPTVVDGIIYFRLPDAFRLDDVEQVRQRLQGPAGIQVTWRLNSAGVIEKVAPASDPATPDTEN
ncbi:hypothetical protein Val02_78480 [Virgisporangium aliadipatigenens]|uniref:Uncharacterized protein n=2 Tax=Virgisporangium aliadipatigenens TaxID=741659 RepID=A0A8J3YUX8_9ACTN|nr:hypothetical protein Val02_78480 [Virgisporangium aliadipatigenens]